MNPHALALHNGLFSRDCSQLEPFDFLLSHVLVNNTVLQHRARHIGHRDSGGVFHQDKTGLRLHYLSAIPALTYIAVWRGTLVILVDYVCVFYQGNECHFVIPICPRSQWRIT